MADVRAGIFALELRRAGQAISVMIAMAVGAACLATATLVLIAMLGVWWAIDSGISRPVAMLTVVGVNLVLMLALSAGIRGLGRRLGFDHTRASLRACDGGEHE